MNSLLSARNRLTSLTSQLTPISQVLKANTASTMVCLPALFQLSFPFDASQVFYHIQGHEHIIDILTRHKK